MSLKCLPPQLGLALALVGALTADVLGAPAFTPNTLSLNGGSGAASVSGTEAAGGDMLDIDGTGFGSDPTAVTMAVGTFPCLVVASSTTDTHARCITTEGSGSNLTIQLTVGSDTAVSTDTFSYPVGPTLTSITGCSDMGNTTTDCPQVGTIPVVIMGTGFDRPLAVLVGGKLCQLLQLLSSSLLQCSLPPGSGLDVPVRVMANGQLSNEGTLSYAPTPTDSLKCWKAKDLRQPAFVPAEGMQLDDELATDSVSVKKPSLVCNPADTGSGIADATAHKCCYKLKGTTLEPLKQLEIIGTVGGTLKLELSKPQLMCEPCSRMILP